MKGFCIHFTLLPRWSRQVGSLYADGTIEYEGRRITEEERGAIIAKLPDSKFPAYITVQIVKPRGDA